MRLKDLLINSDFINDETTLITSRQIIGNICDIRRGNWYQDHVLDLMDFIIKRFDFDFEQNILSVALTLPEEEREVVND